MRTNIQVIFWDWDGIPKLGMGSQKRRLKSGLGYIMQLGGIPIKSQIKILPCNSVGIIISHVTVTITIVRRQVFTSKVRSGVLPTPPPLICPCSLNSEICMFVGELALPSP